MPGETVTKETAALYLRDIEPMWKAFWLHMHLVAKNLEEFASGLGQISDDVFAYHVSGQKNDLAKWVQEVVGDAMLAQRLAGVGSKEDAAAIVGERVAELRAIAGS
jgi:hypothetical protein